MVVPTQLKVLRGNPGKRRIYPEPMPVQGEAPPEPPDFLSGYAREEWQRVVIELYRLRLLTVLDINVLAAYCQSYGRWRTAEEALAKMAEKDATTSGILIKGINGGLVQNPLLKAASQAVKSMVEYASEFGLSPLARGRIAAGLHEDRKQSKFDGLLAG